MNLAPHSDDNLGMFDPSMDEEKKRRDLLRQRLEQKLMETERAMPGDYQIDKEQRSGDSKAARDVNFMGLVNQSAAKFGSLGGQTPDTSASRQFTQNLLGSMGDYNQSMREDRQGQSALRNYLMDKLQSQEQGATRGLEQKERLLSDAQGMREKNRFQKDSELAKLDVEQKAKQAERNHEMAMQQRKQEHEMKLAGMRQPTNNLAQSQTGKPGSSTAVKDQPEEQPYMMADEEKTTTKNLATKNASKIAISNQMKGYLNQYRMAKSPDQKVVIGRQMLKVLNSPEGADAIGVEESRRLGSLLEYQLFNVFNPGPLFGRDLEGFDQQVVDTISAVDAGVEENQKMIESLKSGRGMQLSKVAPTPKTFKDGSLVAAPKNTTQPSQEDAQALKFIQDNPQDPRVPAIKEMLKQKGIL